jgi:FkbM family methyltransferase
MKNQKYIIIDVGAACGKMTEKWMKQLKKKGEFYCIEPVPKSFEKLKTNLQNNAQLFNFAISDAEGVFPFYVSKYVNASSLLPLVDKNIKWWKQPNGCDNIDVSDTETIQVEVKRLDTFLKECSLDTCIIDFIKIDTQGNDFNVVKSLGDLIYNVKEIMLEVQIVPFEYYKGQSKKLDVVNYMFRKGFAVYRRMRQSKNQEENIWFTNKRFNWFLHLI